MTQEPWEIILRSLHVGERQVGSKGANGPASLKATYPLPPSAFTEVVPMEAVIIAFDLVRAAAVVAFLPLLSLIGKNPRDLLDDLLLTVTTIPSDGEWRPIE